MSAKCAIILRYLHSTKGSIMKDSPRVALVSGFWGQNIGNAFFNVGGKYILEQIFDHNVDFIQDQPGYRTFHRKSKGNPNNDLNLLKHIIADYIVLQGPMLSVNFRNLWEDTFKSLTKRGTKIILLSASMFKYTTQEIEFNKRFLEEYPPLLICTRDHITYEHIKGYAKHSFNGIDSAFFVPDTYKPFDINTDPYITINYDRYPEPDIYLSTTPNNKSIYDKEFEALGSYWKLRFPKVQMRFSEWGKAQAYLGALIDFRKLPKTIGDYSIIRTEHRYNPHITWKIYKQPNTVASDEPFTYFTIYAGSSLTLSDRVHACVVTLAYGKPAMLFSRTNRAVLFDRLGLGEIRSSPVLLEKSKLEDEKKNQIQFLRNAIQ